MEKMSSHLEYMKNQAANSQKGPSGTSMPRPVPGVDEPQQAGAQKEGAKQAAQAKHARKEQAMQFESQGLNRFTAPPDNETARTDDTDTTVLPNESSCTCKAGQ